MMQTQGENYDVVIIGGGPAGSCAAAVLAKGGLKVLVLERERFPRFHIGESLLPAGNRVLRETGAWEKVEKAGFITKYGVEFESPDGGVRIHNLFANGILPDCDYAYQVERAKFDEVLLDHAASCGATVLQGHAVRSVEELSAAGRGGSGADEGAVTTGNAGGSNTDGMRAAAGNGKTGSGGNASRAHYRVGIEVVGQGERGKAVRFVGARWLMDASGRDCVLGKLLGLKADRGYFPPRVAVYAHFRNVERSAYTNGGNIIVTRVGEGWSWHIPIDAERVSVGIVSPTKEFREAKLSAADYFFKKMQTAPALAARMKNAQVADTDGVDSVHSQRDGGFHITADYAYTREAFAGERYFLIGDAACFSDPIFSSGVMMAQNMALAAAKTLLKADAARGHLSAAEQARYSKQVKHWLRFVEAMVNNFYEPWGFDLMLHPTDKFQMFAAINSMTAGNFSPPWGVRLRYEIFLILARLNRKYPLTGRAGNPLRTWENTPPQSPPQSQSR